METQWARFSLLFSSLLLSSFILFFSLRPFVRGKPEENCFRINFCHNLQGVKRLLTRLFTWTSFSPFGWKFLAVLKSCASHSASSSQVLFCIYISLVLCNCLALFLLGKLERGAAGCFNIAEEMKKKYRKWTLVIMRRLAWARQQSWVVFFSDVAPPSQCGSSRYYGFERDTQEELQLFIWMATLFKSASVLHDEINSQHKNLKRSNMMNWKKRQIQQQMMMKCSPRALVQTDCVR